VGAKLTAAQALVAYGRAWFEPDHDGRVEALRRCCTEDIVFVQGPVTYRGLDEVAAMIGSFSSSVAAPAPPTEGEASSEGRDRGRTGANGVRVDVVTAIEEMGSFFRYSFVWTLPDGTRGPGTDFCEVADDGRMKLITVWPASDDFPLPDAARPS
jgi:hypothetical protein